MAYAEPHRHLRKPGSPRITVGHTDVFEQEYTDRLRSHFSGFGIPIEYSKDRATIDLGYHLYNPREDDHQHRTLSNVRIWMQCKGLRAETLPRVELERTGIVAVPNISTEHVHFWYLADQPVYLVAYVESVEAFFAKDVRQLVDEQIRPRTPADITRTHTVTLKLTVNDTLDKMCRDMLGHRSMRIDGAQFRGIPLSHSFDPLRTTFKQTSPEMFRDIVDDVLKAHHFRSEELIDVQGLFDRDIGDVSIKRGILYSRYEWTSPWFTEYGHDGRSGYRIESEPLSAQGKVAVIVHAQVDDHPRPTDLLKSRIRTWLEDDDVTALVFYNDDAKSLMGSWRSSFDGICSVPQGIDSLSFNILTMPSLYMKYMYELEPDRVHPIY